MKRKESPYTSPVVLKEEERTIISEGEDDEDGMSTGEEPTADFGTSI